MERNDLLSGFTQYIEDLCKTHVLIQHSEDRKHFVRLDNDEMLQGGRSQLYPPIVTLERLTIRYTGLEDSIHKSRNIEMMFLDHVQDAGDFNRIEQVFSRMESVAEDFLRKMNQDKQLRTEHPYLRFFSLNSADMEYVENIATHLWGVLLSLEVKYPFDYCLPEGRFI